MHKLKNERHDAVARLLAKDWNQVTAYRKVYAPAGDCRAAASRLAKRPDVVELIKSIHVEEAAKIYASMGTGTAGRIADLGITPEWIAEQYRVIAAKARASGDFKAATDSVKNIEKMVRSETEAGGGDAPKRSGGPKVSIESMMSILSKLATPTVRNVDDQPAKDSDEVGMLARNRAHRAAARDEQ
ncbi:hypothetical protein [Sulfitobacter pontiacus]|uniref:hypothetical protein n=1 Tax=Sulfitobacter pontiacus TaxID=60137 RepID=UPI0030ED51E8